jgi:hypothetical protein
MNAFAVFRHLKKVAYFGVLALALLIALSPPATATPVTTGLVLELRADAGITADGGGLVSAWADQSVEGNHVAQSGDDALKPQLISGITNGPATFSAIRFDGIDDVLSRFAPETVNNLATNVSGGTIFLVSRVAAGVSGNQVAMGYGTNDANRVSIGFAPGVNWNARMRVGGAGSAGSTASVTSVEAGGAGAPLADTFYVQAMVWPDTTVAGLQAKLLMPNGAVVTGADTGTAAAGAFTPTALHVGRLIFNTSAGTNLQGDIAEILMYNTALSESDQQLVFNFLGQKYGVTSAAHPGDFDGDSDVDGADFVAWQTNFPTASGATLAQGDADGDGDVDGADFVVWQTNFPFTPSPGGAAMTIPEPRSYLLITFGLTALLAIKCRRACRQTRSHEQRRRAFGWSSRCHNFLRSSL